MQKSTPHSSAHNPFSQINSLHASEAAMYAASVVDKVTMDCNVALQLTAQLPTVNT
jgi:hypothetical protein